jgi:hypothetical protein
MRRLQILAVAGVALAAPAAALGHSAFRFGPDLRVAGQSVGGNVAFKLTLTPSYPTAKPGVTVTMTNCKYSSAPPIRVVAYTGGVGPGQTLRARPGRVVWDLRAIPAAPTKRLLLLRLHAPNGQTRLCVQTSMYDRYTRSTTKLVNNVPL